MCNILERVENPNQKKKKKNGYYYTQDAGLVGSVGCASNQTPGSRGFESRRVQQHTFVEIDHEIVSTAILSRPLIQEGHLSVSDERMGTGTG